MQMEQAMQMGTSENYMQKLGLAQGQAPKHMPNLG